MPPSARPTRRLDRIITRASLAFALLMVAISASAAPPPKTSQAPGKQLTVERLLSPPSLSGHITRGIEWQPGGKRFSYLENKGGSLELWTMDAATGEKKLLVGASTLQKVMQPRGTKAIQSTGLGRVHAENYLWSPTGNALLFVGDQSLVLLDLPSMTSKDLVSGSDDLEDPKFSPDGQFVSFVRSANLWIVNISTGAVSALTSGGSEEILKGQLDWVYPEELDARTAYWWSPDSSKVAYYEMDERPVTRYPIMDMSSPTGAMEYTRYPQAGEANPIVRVGVVSVANAQTQWMDTGSDTDVYLARVDWLRDSSSVAIQRLNRAQNHLDLLFCNAATGESQSVLTETDKYWINISDDLYFFSDNKRFLWSSERSGFRHYYLYDLSGRQLEQLTSGDWNISAPGGFGPGATTPVSVDETGGFVYFSSNKDSVTQNNLYRVSLADKSITRVTHDPGTHDVSIAPGAGAFVDTFSTAAAPPRQDLYRADGTLVAVINANKVSELAGYHLSPVEFLTLPADDGTKLYAAMIKPPDFDPAKKYPVLVYVYGGPHVEEVVDQWDPRTRLFHQILAEKGYIIFTVDNRGSWGRGHAFETPIYHQFGKVELEDQLAGVKYLKSLSYVDPSRVGIWGWSYGGYMTLEALFRAPGVFKAGVSVAPVTDWHLYDTIYTERYMGRPQDNPDGYKNSSPVNQAAELRAKLLLIHSTGDDNVHFANTAEVLNELVDAGKYPADLMIFPGRGHGMSDRAAQVVLYNRIAQFLLGNL
ncbi:MAG: DPP IV N-terminal domain-containing protein [Candidatus Acidiferrales bacterium]